MTVASLAIAAFGAASNAFWMRSVVCACADALIANAITARTNGEIRFWWPPVARLQNLGVENPVAVYHDGAYSALLNFSADGQAARYALGNRLVKGVIAQSPQKRDQIHVLLVKFPQLANQRIELLAAALRVPGAPAAGVFIEP